MDSGSECLKVRMTSGDSSGPARALDGFARADYAKVSIMANRLDIPGHWI